MGRVRIVDVAAAAGVSKATVSNFLNGRTRRMSEDTMHRIDSVIRELNYAPSLAARHVSRKGNSGTVCIIIPHSLGFAFNQPFFSRIMHGIGDALEQFGLRPIVISGRRDVSRRDVEYIRGLSSGMVDGFLLFEIERGDIFINELERDQIPYVCFGYDPQMYSSGKYIASDHGGGTFEAVTHLIEVHGHRRVAFYPGFPKAYVTQQRIEGYRRALKHAHIPYDPDLVVYEYGEDFDCGPATAKLLEARDPATAFLISQINTAGFMKALQKKKRRPGPELGLILTEYFPLGAYERYQYSHLAAPVYDIGTAGVQLLMRQIRGEASRGPNDLFPVHLVAGETCGCAK